MPNTPVNTDFPYSNQVSRNDIIRMVPVDTDGRPIFLGGSTTAQSGYAFSGQVSGKDILKVVPVDVNTGEQLPLS